MVGPREHICFNVKREISAERDISLLQTFLSERRCAVLNGGHAQILSLHVHASKTSAGSSIGHMNTYMELGVA